MQDFDALDAWLTRLSVSGIAAVCVERHGFVVSVERVARSESQAEGNPQPVAGSAVDRPDGQTAEEVMVCAPLAGVFYRAVAPDASPFVTVGERVRVGQTVGLIESMKLMNECDAQVAGRVTRILAADGQAVAWGEPLLALARCAEG